MFASFGPNMDGLGSHVFVLFVKQYCRLSYRTTSTFLRDLGFDVATKSTLQRYTKKLKIVLMDKGYVA